MESDIDSKYFDYAASSPPWPETLKIYAEEAKIHYANPSSNHAKGKKAKEQLLKLKKEFCDLLHFYDGRLLLCASGSEANNTIIEGHLKQFPKAQLLLAEDVHDSIWYALKKYPKSVKVLKIDSSGEIPFSYFEKAINNATTLVCLNHASNETGTIHPIREMVDIATRKGVRILIDGMQTVGHIPINLNEISFTYYTFSGHKFGAPRSTGGILLRDSQFTPLISGGKQEWGMRAGTEDLAGLAAMVSSLKRSINNQENEMARLAKFKNKIIHGVNNLSGVVINSPVNGMPGLLSLSFRLMTGNEIVSMLSLKGFSLSTGSACQANQLEPSRILMAMGRSLNEAQGSLRISMGFGTTSKAVDELIAVLQNVLG